MAVTMILFIRGLQKGKGKGKDLPPCPSHQSKLCSSKQKKDRTTYYVEIFCLTEPKYEKQLFKRTLLSVK